MIKLSKNIAAPMLLFTLLISQQAIAQTASQPSSDWSSSWAFTNNGLKTQRLLQADIIRKGEGDYYDNVGKTTMYITNDNRQGSFDNIQATGDAVVNVETVTGEKTGKKTNTIGSINTSTNEIFVDGTGNSIVLTNEATSTGCQNGSINLLDENGTLTLGADSADCN